MLDYHGRLEEKRLLTTRLLYGMYPEVLNNPGNEREVLKNLAGSYLYKDIFTFQDIRKPAIIERLLEAFALQIGSQVSYNELAQIVGVKRETIQRYIDLLEKAFVVFRLRSLSRNLRNELKKSVKIYCLGSAENGISVFEIKVEKFMVFLSTRRENIRSAADKVKAALRRVRKERGLGLDFVPRFA